MFTSSKPLFAISLFVAATALAQPSFRITSFISHRDLTDRQKADIERYAQGWSEAMFTDDAKALSEARRSLAEPLDKRWGMSNTARMHYGESLLSAFEPFFAKENKNVMAATNALQVLSLLGTERSVTTMMHHASISSEDRSAIRQWASVGLGNSFQSGKLTLNRLKSAATLLADAASLEPVWHVATRQLQSLGSLIVTPGLRRSELKELQRVSFRLQVQAISNIIEDIAASKAASLRMRAVRSGLASLRLQLIEPGVETSLKSDTVSELVPVLVRALQVVSAQSEDARQVEELLDSYGGVISTADAMLRRHAGGRDVGDTSIRERWVSGDDGALKDVISYWQAQVPLH